MACLKRISGDAFELFPLSEGITTIGRSSRCDLNFSSPVVSKLHAVIECNTDVCTLRNESFNGTSVNGQKITDELTLQNGDCIRIGMEYMIFYDSDSHEISSLGSFQLHANATAGDPDDSIQHKSALLGKPLGNEAPRVILADKIRAQISLRDQSVASLSTTDSVRKLSQSLRLARVLREYIIDKMLDPVFDAVYQFFPQATQIVIVQETAEGNGSFQVSATHSRSTVRDTAIVCDEVILYAAHRSECLLIADQWRQEPEEKPRLSSMGRISIMCVPVQTLQGRNCGVVQLIAEIPGPEFDIDDLERLTILGQFLTMILPLQSA